MCRDVPSVRGNLRDAVFAVFQILPECLRSSCPRKTAGHADDGEVPGIPLHEASSFASENGHPPRVPGLPGGRLWAKDSAYLMILFTRPFRRDDVLPDQVSAQTCDRGVCGDDVG